MPVQIDDISESHQKSTPMLTMSDKENVWIEEKQMRLSAM